MLAAALLAFALSIDDFVITYFNAGADVDVPALRLGGRPRGRAAAGQRHRHRDLRRRGRASDSATSSGSTGAPREVEQQEPYALSYRHVARSTSSKAARDHLWLHFTRMGGYADGDVPIIVRGEGCHLEDSHGKRYLDALAGLFAVQIGYSYGDEIGQAAHEQMRELPFYTNWSYAHPRAIELAAEVASLAPGDLNRVFFVSGRLGGRGVGLEARAAVPHGPRRAALEGGLAQRRLPRHDDGRALDQRHPGAARPVRAARPRGRARPQHEPLPPPARRRPRPSSRRSCSTTSSTRCARRARTRWRW